MRRRPGHPQVQLRLLPPRRSEEPVPGPRKREVVRALADLLLDALSEGPADDAGVGAADDR